MAKKTKKQKVPAQRNFVAKHTQSKSGAGVHVPKEQKKKAQQKAKQAMKKEARGYEPL
jgi:hypothetical protein